MWWKQATRQYKGLASRQIFTNEKKENETGMMQLHVVREMTHDFDGGIWSKIIPKVVKTGFQGNDPIF